MVVLAVSMLVIYGLHFILQTSRFDVDRINAPERRHNSGRHSADRRDTLGEQK